MSSLAVVLLFSLIHLAIVGVVPWREAALSKENLPAEFMRRVHGSWAATVVTICLVGSCFASAFAGTLGYSRVPYAAARRGHFFSWFGAIHATHRIPHRSLLLVGGMILFWSFFSLETIIEQFVAQIFAVVLLRNKLPEWPRPWRMWLYPLPCVVALVGWLYVYFSSEWLFIAIGIATLLVGAVFFLALAKRRRSWPFA